MAVVAGYSLPLLGVGVAEGDGVDRVVSPEEDPVKENERSRERSEHTVVCVLQDSLRDWEGGDEEQDEDRGRKEESVLVRGHGTHFLWLSVRVMPCVDTLKWTMVAVGAGPAASVSEMALAMACGPVRDSISTELMYRTLQAEKSQGRISVRLMCQRFGHQLSLVTTCTLHYIAQYSCTYNIIEFLTSTYSTVYTILFCIHHILLFNISKFKDHYPKTLLFLCFPFQYLRLNTLTLQHIHAKQIPFLCFQFKDMPSRKRLERGLFP